MKKILGTFSAYVVYLTTAAPALAGITEPAPTNITNVCTIAQKFIDIAFGLAALIAILFLIYGGIKWVISGGDKAAVEGARNTIIAALVGLIIVIISFAIVKFGIGIVTGSTLDQIIAKIPGC